MQVGFDLMVRMCGGDNLNIGLCADHMSNGWIRWLGEWLVGSAAIMSSAASWLAGRTGGSTVVGRNATWSAGPVPTGNIGIQVAPPRRADCALLQQRRTTPSFLNHPRTSVRLTPSTLFPVCRSSMQWRSRAIS